VSHLFYSLGQTLAMGRRADGLWFSPVCDSYVRPETLVRICDECNFGTYGGRCIICGSPGKEFFPLPPALLTCVAFPRPIQGSRMPTIALSVRAWRKTVMAVPKLSILVPVEQIYSMSGVVLVSLCRAHDFIYVLMTVSQASRRVSLCYHFSEILAYYVVRATQIPTKLVDTNRLQT
jgi:hypothetical protein